MSFVTGRYTVVPPIPLKKEAEKPETKGSFFKTKVYPSGGNDATKAYDLSIRHFSSGTTEEWITDYISFMSACGMGPPMNLFTLARVFLKGDALSKFNAICTDSGIVTNNKTHETRENFDIVTGKLSVLLMPRDALSTQKEAMVYYMRKPTDMKIRTYVTRLNELNDYLEHFPPNFSEAQKFSKQSLVDLVVYGMPPKWKLKLSTDFGTIGKDAITMEFLVDFGERQEMLELASGTSTPTHIPRNPHVASIPRKAGKTYSKPYAPGTLAKYAQKTSHETKKWCPYHKTNSHDANECVVVKKLAAQASSARDAKYDSKPAASPTKFDKKQFQTFVLYTEWQKAQEADTTMMCMETDDDAIIEEVPDTNGSHDSGQPDDGDDDDALDNLSLSDFDNAN